MSGTDRMTVHVGMQVHRWIVLRRSDDLIARAGRRRARWHCRCSCGVEKPVLQQSLLLALRSSHGGSRSCGCIARETAFVHGHAQGGQPSPEYNCWLAAKKRCQNPTNASYPLYGGRGIRMCPRWSASFAAFLGDVGPKPLPSWSLDRINPERGYEPGNCAWVPPIVQAQNKRSTCWWEFEGQPAVIGEVARFLGISREHALSLGKRGLLPARKMREAPNHALMGNTLVLDLNQAEPPPAVPQSGGGRHA
jgi:hypothetical protein